jgi:hypothetical protein
MQHRLPMGRAMVTTAIIRTARLVKKRMMVRVGFWRGVEAFANVQEA